MPQYIRPSRLPTVKPSRLQREQPGRRRRGSARRRPGSDGRGQGGRPPESQSERRVARTTTPPATTRGRILIVDDEPAIRLICRINLQFEGFETLEAEDGQAALALAERERPDLILLDVMMPPPSGWEVAEKLAQRAATRDIPIVFLTARAEAMDERRGYELGGVGYVQKPFEPEQLPHFVEHVLDRVGRGEREDLRAEWLAALERREPGA